jgi:uncharacterized membrane protein YoaK (UPF0700 family)
MTLEFSVRSYRTLPVMLGFAAGYVDGCTFVALFGLFVAQVTGSFVIAGAVLVVREHGTLVKVLAVPAFLFGVIVATAVVSVARHTGRRASPIVLGLETLLLAGLLATGLVVPGHERSRSTGGARRRAIRALRNGGTERLHAPAHARRAVDQRHDHQHHATDD